MQLLNRLLKTKWLHVLRYTTVDTEFCKGDVHQMTMDEHRSQICLLYNVCIPVNKR